MFDRVGDAYDLAGADLPWRKGQFTPVVPVTVEIGGATAGPRPWRTPGTGTPGTARSPDDLIG